jgi:AcrR family transcriptional regulator
VTSTGSRAEERRLTARGAATRARIVDAAAQLMATRGVAATTLDDVLAASGTSKSQLYHHFEDKDALVHAVVQQQGEQVLELNARGLSRLNSMRGLELWREAVLQKVTVRNGAFGCELGSLAAELSDVDEDARVMLASMFQAWEQLFIDGFERMQQRGVLRDDAEPDRLATAVISALQGGYLLAQTAHAVEPMRVALDMALDYVRSFQAGASGAAPKKHRVAQKRRTKTA